MHICVYTFNKSVTKNTRFCPVFEQIGNKSVTKLTTKTDIIMATLSLNLDKRCLRNGMAHVRIRISHKCTNAFVSTGVYVEPQYFQYGSLYDPIHRKAIMAVEKRESIADYVRSIEDWLSSIDATKLACMTANDIKERACGCTRVRTRIKKEPVDIPVVDRTHKNDFVHWFGEYGESRQTPKTRESYVYGWNVLREYCKSLGMLTLSFADIDYARLADFARWLTATGRGQSTRHMLECYVRAAYKEAQRRHLVSRENDPYYDYSIRPVPLKKIERLTAEQMHAFMTTDLKKKGHKWARDLAMMSFYLCGANLIDLYEMPKAKASKVEFVRHKVELRDQRPLEIRIEPEMAALISRYKGDDHLLHFKGTYGNYESFRHKIGHRLREVSDELGFDVSMAKVRRTWASIAASLGVSDWVIDKSMGHMDSTITKRHYADYDWNLTAEANRKVIDAVTKSA